MPKRFERIAKMIFIRLQAANDTGDLNDLRAFTTPEMFAAVRLDLQERGRDGAAHRRRHASTPRCSMSPAKPIGRSSASASTA